MSAAVRRACSAGSTRERTGAKPPLTTKASRGCSGPVSGLRGSTGTQQGEAAASGWWEFQRSAVHSQTLPIRSTAPYVLGG